MLPTWRQWLKWLRHGVALNVTGGEFLVMSRFDHGHGVFSSIVHNSFIIYELKWGGHLLPTWRQWLKWLRHGVALNVTGGEFLVMSRFDHGHGVFSSIVHN